MGKISRFSIISKFNQSEHHERLEGNCSNAHGLLNRAKTDRIGINRLQSNAKDPAHVTQPTVTILNVC